MFQSRLFSPSGETPCFHAALAYQGRHVYRWSRLRFQLSGAAVETRTVDGIDFLVVERYDRRHGKSADGKPTLERLHQEHFCQVLGFVSEMKYQVEGGPSLKQRRRPAFGLLSLESSLSGC